MPAVEFWPVPPRAGEGAAYVVAIGGRAARIARVGRVGRRWPLEYGGGVLTLASLAAARALVERYADKIRDGRALDANEPLEGLQGAKHKAG